MTNTTITKFAALINELDRIRTGIAQLPHLPIDTLEVCDHLVRRLEVAQARAEHTERTQSILERERACARRAGQLAVVEAAEAKAAAPAGKRRGKEVSVEVEAGHHVVVRPGLSIRLHGLDRNRVGGPVEYDRTFEIGDTVAMDSYNLVYMGQIERIGAKTVTIRGRLGVKRLRLEQFSWRNRHFDVETAARRNAEESYCI